MVGSCTPNKSDSTGGYKGPCPANTYAFHLGSACCQSDSDKQGQPITYSSMDCLGDKSLACPWGDIDGSCISKRTNRPTSRQHRRESLLRCNLLEPHDLHFHMCPWWVGLGLMYLRRMLLQVPQEGAIEHGKEAQPSPSSKPFTEDDEKRG